MSDVCVFDGQVVVNGGSIVAGSNVFDCTGHPFSCDDCGKLFRLPGAGPAGTELDTTITQIVSSSEILLADNATCAVTNSPFWWGTDLAPAIQAAFNNGGKVSFPKGLGLIGSTLMVPGHLKAEGAGRYASQLQPPSGQGAILVAVPGGGYSTVLADFGIAYASQQPTTAPAAISVSAGSTEHTGFDMRDCRVMHASWAVYFLNASYFRITGCELINNSNGGVIVQNTNNPDSGDSVISGNTIFNPSITSGPTLGILQLNSGGLRVENNKFNSFNQAVQLRLSPGAVTCDLLIIGNSMESVGFTTPNAPILCQRSGATGSFHSLIVDGNQFNGWGYGFANVGSLVNAVANSPAWLTKITIGTNVIL